MEAIGRDLLEYARTSQMPALCQYLEQLSGRSAAEVLPFVQPSCAESDKLTGIGKISAGEAGFMAKSSSGEASRCAGACPVAGVSCSG